MKAAFIEQFGGPEVLKYGDLPAPVAAPGEVVIDVVAASVNAADWKFRAGQYAKNAQSKFPLIPGRDFSGVISAAGNGVEDLNVGDAVFGVCEAGQEGAYAEKIAVKAAIIAKKPEGLSHVNAAALALTGLTAISAIEETLKLQPGETILIQGGAGGVASFAIQFAKQIGAYVITTTSAANRDYGSHAGVYYNAYSEDLFVWDNDEDNDGANIRRKLLDDGHIDTVIGLPANLFYSTGIPVCILVLKKCKRPDDVLFINAGEHFVKGKRQNQLTDQHIENIVTAYKHRKEQDRYARRVSMKEIAENDYTLNISRYVSTALEEAEVDLAATHAELVRIEGEIAKATAKHNEFLKELGLPLLPSVSFDAS